MISLCFFMLLAQENPVIKGVLWEFGDSAVTEDYIAISTDEGYVYIYDKDLKLIKRMNEGNVNRVYTVGKYLFLVKGNNFQTKVILNGEVKGEIGLRPFSMSSDENILVVFPWYHSNIEIENNVMKREKEINQGIVQKILFRRVKGTYLTTVLNKPFVPITIGLLRSEMYHRGIFIFKDNENSVEIVFQTDPLVYSEKNKSFVKLDLPGFVYNKNQIEKDEKIWLHEEYLKMKVDFFHDTSLIWGVYRIRNRFIVCYSKPGFPIKGPYRICIFDSGWRKVSQSIEITDRLIGVDQNVGFFLTDRNRHHSSILYKEKIELLLGNGTEL